MSSHLRIVVAGYLIRAPLGGQAWHYLQYVVGLVQLGHEVLYIEDSCYLEDDETCWCLDPATGQWGHSAAPGLAFVGAAMRRLGLGERWAFYDGAARNWHGPASARAVEFCRSADVFLNVSGCNPLRDWLRDIPRRVFIDTDPAFMQVRMMTNDANRALAAQHNVLMTFGENIAAHASTLPTDGQPWLPTRQPIVLSQWRVTPGRRSRPLTTVMAWQTYEPLEHNGRRYGAKGESFAVFIDLPSRSREQFELALSGNAPRERLQTEGWLLASRMPQTMEKYRAYIQRSKAEFGVAKHGYVVSNCGWFSERSAAYMASGRPVVVQDTGFSRWLPCGLGVLAFTTPVEALTALDDLDARYTLHCRAARELAAEHFDARVVLGQLINQVMPSPTVAWPTAV